MANAYQSMEDMARDLRAGKLSAQELAERAQTAYEATEPTLNAYKAWNGATAVKQAQAIDTLISTGLDLGPLMGLPVSVKDLYGVTGMPVFAGSDQALPEAYSHSGPVVQTITQQLGVITGKTHTVEFAFGGLGVNAHWGTPRNPWSRDGHRVPGGSSSGAGVSLAQGTAVLALGTDTAGSVRVPASFTGQAGLKTTAGRWPAEQIVPLSSSLDTPGILARTVEDLAYSFSAIEGSLGYGDDAEVPYADLSALRIGVPTNFFWEDIDASISTQVDDAISRLASHASGLQRVELPACDEAYEIFRAGGLAAPELSHYMQMHFPEKIARLDPVVRLRVEGAEQVSSVEYLRRKAVLEQCGLRGLSAFANVDVLVTPTIPIPPPLLSEIEDIAAYGKANMLALRNTVIANLFGWCALTLPIGLDKRGLPVGLQLMAPPLEEYRLLAMGQAFERCLGKGPDLLGAVPGLGV